MKKITFINILLFLMLPFLASAQEKTLEFYYIAHDYSTKVNDVCSMLEEKYEMALEFEDCAMIFYLPNKENPIVVKMNLEGDNRDEFSNLLAELRGRYAHDSYSYVDLQTITDIFNQHDILDESGMPAYRSVLMTWYINPSFLSLNYNETLIASLYFILELDKYSDYVTIDIWNASDERINFNRERPFGNKNLVWKHPFHMLIL